MKKRIIKKTPKKSKPYNGKFKKKYGLSLLEISRLVPDWSYGSVWNVLTKPGYEEDRKLLLFKIECHLAKKKSKK